MSRDILPENNRLISSMIQEVSDDSPFYIKCLKKIDLFSFIPVPKDDAVSTKRSLCGSTTFFIIFVAYVIFDFFQFLTNNPPISQNSYTPIDTGNYPVPDFALTFMEGQFLNQTQTYDKYFQFAYNQQSKDKGTKGKDIIGLAVNRKDMGWLDSETKNFYSVLRSPLRDTTARGLLYSTANATYAKIEVNKCNLNVPNNTCAKEQQIASLLGKGRIFLFLKNNAGQEDVKYLLYNFFLINNMYKRVIIQLQVQRTVTEPDYFWQWTENNQQAVTIQSVMEQTSDTSINDKEKRQTSLELLSIQFQMSSQVLNTRVSKETLIQHVSMWGAFWSVLFGVFAIIFLSYNRKKFYKKRPDWNKYKGKLNTSNQDQGSFT